MNRDQWQGKWKQLSGKVKAEWGKLTDDDLDQIDGNRERLEGRIQEIYGIQREEARRQIEDFERRV